MDAKTIKGIIMKKFLLLALVLCAMVASLEARHWRRGWGGWGGWGWGPGIGVGFTVPIGGRTKYIAPVESGDPYTRYQALFPKSNPLKRPETYQQWLYTNYPRSAADHWWNKFASRYNIYQAAKPQPAGYFSVGSGGYWGGPYWGGWGYPGYWGGWGRPGISFGVGF
jgi:hypothetical protein